MSNKPQITFHIGLAKVASTFLQNSIFPKFEEIGFTRDLRYRYDRKFIAKGEYDKYLISREYDWNIKHKLREFADDYPGAKVIMILRRHDSWIASEYRKDTKNGQKLDFDEFFNIDDTGKIPTGELNFMDKIKTVEGLFGTKPLVLFIDDLKNDPWAFIDKIAKFSGAAYSKEKMSLSRVHTSYNEKQLKIMRSFSRKFIPTKRKYSNQPVIHWIQRRLRLLLSYMVLYPSLLVPSFMVSKEDLIPLASLKKIREFYDSDWQACIKYAAENPA